MLLTDARRLARTGAEGELIPLAEQDRALWDRQQIAEGVALLSATLPKGSVGPYQLQAAVCRRSRRSCPSRGHGLAADSGALRFAPAHVRQPNGRVESRDRGGDGARSDEGLGAAGCAQRGCARRRTSPHGRGAGASARTRRETSRPQSGTTEQRRRRQRTYRSAITFSRRLGDSRAETLG